MNEKFYCDFCSDYCYFEIKINNKKKSAVLKCPFGFLSSIQIADKYDTEIKIDNQHQEKKNNE